MALSLAELLSAPLGASVGLCAVLFGIPEDPVLIGHAEPEGKQDLALGVQAAGPSGFDAIDRERGDAGFPGQLGLAHHQRLTETLDVVPRHLFPPMAACTDQCWSSGDLPEYRRPLTAT